MKLLVVKLNRFKTKPYDYGNGICDNHRVQHIVTPHEGIYIYMKSKLNANPWICYVALDENLRNKTNKRCSFPDSCVLFISSQMHGFEYFSLEIPPHVPFDLCWNNVTWKNIILVIYIIIIPPSGDVTDVKGHEINPSL